MLYEFDPVIGIKAIHIPITWFLLMQLFYALSYKLHVRERYVSSMENFYGQNGYDEFVESLYENIWMTLAGMWI